MRASLIVWGVFGTLLTIGATAAAPPARGNPKKAYGDLKSPAFATRQAAIETLAASGDAGAVDAIVGALKDEDPTVRWAACEALEKLGGAKAIEALQGAKSDEAPWVAERARDALRALTKDTTLRQAGVLAVKTLGADRSGSGVASVPGEMERAAAAAIGLKQVKVTAGAEEPSHLVTVAMQSVKETSNGADTIFECSGTATVTEQPGNQLRFTTKVGAAMGLSGKLTPQKRSELTLEAARAIGQRLGEESADWLKNR